MQINFKKIFYTYLLFCSFLFIGIGTGLSARNQVQLKPEMKGLVGMGAIGRLINSDGGFGYPDIDLNDVITRPGIFGGLVFNLGWSQLEPEQGILDTKIIDDQLVRIRVYNQMYPLSPLSVRLRIFTGCAAPFWAKNLGGIPVDITRPDEPLKTVGRFWTTEHRIAWRSFQNRLAAVYDSEPLIVDVQVVSGMTNTGEPLNIIHTDEAINNLHAAGYTDLLFKDILENSGEDYAAWQTTRLTFVLSPFRNLDGKSVTDSVYAIQLMKLYRSKFGERAILSDHALQYPYVNDFRQFIYNNIFKLGPPINFQTQSPKDLNVGETVAEGVRLGAKSVEIWNNFGGFVTETDSALWHWKSFFDSINTDVENIKILSEMSKLEILFVSSNKINYKVSLNLMKSPVYIYNIYGQLCISTTSAEEMSININKLCSGIYILKVQGESAKFIKP